MGEYASAIGAIAAIASAAITTYAAVETSQQQAKLADVTEKQKEIDAQTARETAEFEERQHRRRVALLLGEQQATFAASGFETTSGTPLVQEIDLVRQGELEALNIRRGGSIESASSLFEAGIARYRSRALRGGIPLQIASGVASGVSSGTQAYYGTQSKIPKKQTVTSDWTGYR